jgi:hypothetical protein
LANKLNVGGSVSNIAPHNTRDSSAVPLNAAITINLESSQHSNTLYPLYISSKQQQDSIVSSLLTSVTAPLQRKQESSSLQQNLSDCCLIRKLMIQ